MALQFKLVKFHLLKLLLNFSEFGTLKSTVKHVTADGELNITTTAIFDKAPAYMVENSNIKIKKEFPAIRWHFTCKVTCGNCSIMGH